VYKVCKGCGHRPGDSRPHSTFHRPKMNLGSRTTLWPSVSRVSFVSCRPHNLQALNALYDSSQANFLERAIAWAKLIRPVTLGGMTTCDNYPSGVSWVG
jgi:hypothetical protein